MKIPQSFPVFFAFCLRWLGGEIDKQEKKTDPLLSVFLCSLFSGQSVGRLVSLTALLPLSLSSPCFPSQCGVVST